MTSEVNGTSIDALMAQAKSLRRQGLLMEAATALSEAMRRDPMNPELWFEAGTLAMRRLDIPFAREMFAACTMATPKDHEAWYNFAFSCFRLGDYTTAEKAYRHSIALAPDFVRGHIALGQLLYVVGQPDAGYAIHTHALAMPRPTSWQDRELRALLHVVRGQFKLGWLEFEDSWRTRVQDRSKREIWDGETHRDRDLVLSIQGGSGDVVLFARYIPLAATRVGRVFVGALPILHPLLAPIPGLSGLYADLREAPQDALFASLWLLPRIIGTTPETIPSPGGYMTPPESGPVLEKTSGLRVGLCWYGGKACVHDRDRSTPSLSVLKPLFQVPGVDWFSLQLEGPRTPEEEQFPLRYPPRVKDFGDTAYVMSQLDLVISVDTAVANLAAAIGHPTWVMVPTVPEFRWPLGSSTTPEYATTTPWYATARLYRRTHTDEWEGVATRIATDLAALVRERGGP